MNNNSGIVSRAYSLMVSAGKAWQSPFLLVVRLYFFWQLFNVGKGKLENIGKVIDYFTSLGIPLPGINAYVVGITECVGGILILVGLASRLASVPVIVAMTVAYIAGDAEALANFFSDPVKFVKADPFPFLLSALIVFCFGPGWLSIDGLLGRIGKSRTSEKPLR